MLRLRRILISAIVIAALACVATSASAAAASVRTKSTVRATAATIAQQQVGDPYVAGAAGPDEFDCSGLVSYAFTQAGFDLGVRSSQDMAKLGAAIRRTAIQPGDLVFTWAKNFGHVGIAISATQYVHAPAPGRDVEIAPIPAGKALLGVRRP